MSGIKVNAIEKIVTVKIIQEDVEALYALLKSAQDPVFSLMMIPYYALFIQSCQEYMKETYLEEPSLTIIKNARNYIKRYAEGFEKTRKEVSNADSKQDRYFRELLDFDFLKNWNIYYNIGTYWTRDKKIVGNTQLIAAFLGTGDFYSPERKGVYKELGYQMGAFINSVRIGLSDVIEAVEAVSVIPNETIGLYADFNTNLMDKYTRGINDKVITILFLHLLCVLNFFQYILKPMFPQNNNWILRVEYVLTYYCYRALVRYSNYYKSNHLQCDDSDLHGLIESGKDLFCTKFRNCMMHYDLENKRVLSVEYLEEPFYGIVESCFKGCSYLKYRKRLSAYRVELISFFGRYYCFDNVQIKEL